MNMEARIIYIYIYEGGIFGIVWVVPQEHLPLAGPLH